MIFDAQPVEFARVIINWKFLGRPKVRKSIMKLGPFRIRNFTSNSKFQLKRVKTFNYMQREMSSTVIINLD